MFPIGIQSITQLFSTTNLLIYAGISVINGLILFFASMKFLLVFQQCGYNGKKYFKWLSNKDTPYLSRLMLLCLLCFLFYCVLSTCFEPLVGDVAASYVGFISYLLFSLIYISTERSVNAKVPLRKTKRLVRLSITYILFASIVTFCTLVLMDIIAYAIGTRIIGILRYSLICAIPMITSFIMYIANCINSPFEKIIRKHYLRIAVNKLDHSEVIKIGITGSYGKTSVKEILRTILSQKYRVLATPESFNTPLGIALAVKNLDNTHDVFIAEMGARSKGDIEELAKMVKPKYGLLTGVNSQHLETFGDLETIKDTKFELFENLAENGIGFFSTSNDISVELMARFNGEKYSAGTEGENNLVVASEIKTSDRGTTFTLHFDSERGVKCSTVLLGKHAVNNICLAAAVAYKIGLTPKEIVAGINRIQTIGHRLELLPNNKNIVVIDDSYNSNMDGIIAAMEVLDTFTGRKIVLTPGLVELGKMENLANLEFGKTLAKHADMVIIIGKHNAEMLINGLKEGGMAVENIKFSKSLSKGNELLNGILKEGDVVLFENDLPDNYN